MCVLLALSAGIIDFGSQKSEQATKSEQCTWNLHEFFIFYFVVNHEENPRRRFKKRRHITGYIKKLKKESNDSLKFPERGESGIYSFSSP